MPIYEYRCGSCDKVIEIIQKFSDDPLNTCETCGGELERLISAPGLHFKGSGWYVTDYARAGQKDNGENKPAKTEKTEKKSDSKSDSKSKSEPAKSTSTAAKSD